MIICTKSVTATDHIAAKQAYRPGWTPPDHHARAVLISPCDRQMAQHDDQRANDLDRAAIAFSVVVADGQQVHAVELAAKNRPTRIKQVPAPNGSSTTLRKPPSMNLAGTPSTISEPNQVANVVVMIMNIGRLRPATAKSAVGNDQIEQHAGTPAKSKKVEEIEEDLKDTHANQQLQHHQPQHKADAAGDDGLQQLVRQFLLREQLFERLLMLACAAARQHQIEPVPYCGAVARRSMPRASNPARRAGSCQTRPPPAGASGACRRPTVFPTPGGHGAQSAAKRCQSPAACRGAALSPPHRAARPGGCGWWQSAPGRWTRWPPAFLRTRQKSRLSACEKRARSSLPQCAAWVQTTARVCSSSASSSAISGGSRSRRSGQPGQIDKDGAQALQRLAQALAAWLRPLAAQTEYAADALEEGVVEAGQHHVVQPIKAHTTHKDGEATKESLHEGSLAAGSRSAP
ncbi:hypothetical protein FQA39_LY19367 [Lamprigera yunnana]|nr:hypothetical protein FQA39_LY19367 [Lamprigera yunnana]